MSKLAKYKWRVSIDIDSIHPVIIRGHYITHIRDALEKNGFVLIKNPKKIEHIFIASHDNPYADVETKLFAEDISFWSSVTFQRTQDI